MISRYGTMMWRAAIYLRRSPVNIFDLILWPIILVVPFGLFAKYTASSAAMLTILIVGSIGWVTTGSVQREIALNFMIEIWQRTIKKSRALPITDFEFITGNWIVGMLRGTFTFLLISAVAYMLFGVNIFLGDPLVILLSLTGIFITGLTIGMFVISTVKLLGHRADAIAWFITEILVMFSGIYYSIDVLPGAIKTIAYLSPLTYIFDSMRKTLISHAMLPELSMNFIKMFGLLAVFLIFVSIYFIYAEKRAVETGFYQKYD
jgi:ABC-2 type transport system permease protein